MFLQSNRVRFSTVFPGMGELHRDFHSTPDLAHQVAMMNGVSSKGHRSQEDVTLLGMGRNLLPPPNHPPPPPPIGQLIKVDVSRNASEYDSMTKMEKTIEEGVMSSFRPAASAKLYASPEDMKTVGYRSRSLPSHSARPHVRKSHSMRTPSSFQPAQTSTPPNKSTSGSNPYAQPIRASRSHSTAGTRERKKRLSLGSNVGNAVSVVVVNQTPSTGGPPPPIPEPDYSLSESEIESEEEREAKVSARLSTIPQAVETSGNSNTR